ncbi:TPA: glycosyltransferase family 2 protein, partial [Streptococcus pneumoniae]|nr:glycosyltransferase family 2 protein [Streptococcus pneumoniae]
MSSKVSGFQDKNGKVLKIMIEWWKEKFRRVVVTQNVESLLVSIVISAYNEEKYLPGLIEDLKNQTYPKENIEILFINAMSTDGTTAIIQQFIKEDTEFNSIRLYNNPKKNQASGFNLGVKHSVGDLILKIDAHSKVTETFVMNNVAIIQQGEFVCGGPRPTIVEGKGKWAETLHLVEENMFGSSIANYRNSSEDRYVSSIFHGMYKREVFQKVGLVNEQLGRTEDNDIHYRIREHGYKIRYSPSILSYQYIRPTFKKMLYQKYSNGLWIGLTSHVQFKCLSLFHYVPCLFVLSLVFSLALLPITFVFITLLLGAYFLLLSLLTLLTLLKHKNGFLIVMPFLLFSIHFAYGFGTIVGLIRGFKWKKEYKRTIIYLDKISQ